MNNPKWLKTTIKHIYNRTPMKKFLFLLLFITFTLNVTNAQPPKRLERIEALKVAYMTQALKLTADEAQKFWPVYNSYIVEMKESKKSNKDDELAFQEAALGVRKKYKIEFKKILTDDFRVNQVFKAEAEFRQELQKELQKRIQQRRQQKSQQEPE
jgi:hypothetical protein